ncbi:MAG: DUF6070 family protein [Oscillospiraceae bacterium]
MNTAQKLHHNLSLITHKFGTLSIALVFLLLSFGCSKGGKEPAPTVSSPKAVDTTATSKPMPKNETLNNAPSNIETDAINIANQYKPIYMEIYSGDNAEVNLSEADMKKIVSKLGELGCAAIDAAGRLSMENPQLAKKFFEDKDKGQDVALTIYELCSDAGFVRHDILFFGGDTKVVQTRLAWLDDGPFAIAGDVPTVTYSNEYQITTIKYTQDGHLIYEYLMPSNPEGTNHDGHIDTLVNIRVA